MPASPTRLPRARRSGVFATAAVGLALVSAACQPVFGGGGGTPGSPEPVTTLTVPPVTSPATPTAVATPTSAAPTGTTTTLPPGTVPAVTLSPSSAPTTAPPQTPAPTTAAPAPAATTVTPGRIKPGVTYTGKATHYGDDGGGNCMFDKSNDPNMPFVAMNQLDYENSRMCGAYLEVTGPGGKTTVVMVSNRCPECPAGNLDLSQQAFAKLADPVTGIIDVSWRIVSPASIGNVQYQIKDGSSAYWFAIQVRSHRNPIATLEVQVNGSWQTLPRYEWNHFVWEPGLGPGPFTVRITDFYGEQLVHTVNLAPGSVQTTSSQFSQR